MFHAGNVQGITKFILLSALALSSACFAAVNRVQNDDSHQDQLLQTSSRSLLYSWDDDSRSTQFGYSSSEQTFYIVAIILVAIFATICRCCFKYGCSEEDNHYSNAVVHPPPRLLEPPPSNFDYSAYSGTSGNVLTPPRSSTRSIILPFEAEVFPAHLGFDNPNYHPDNTSSRQFIPQPSHIPSQMGDVLDMPPSYDTVVKESIKYPNTTTKE